MQLWACASNAPTKRSNQFWP